MAPEYHFSFLDLYNTNPTLVGEPTSEQIDIPNVMSIQFTTNGYLVYHEGAGAKFVKQDLPLV